jgi:two-component system response regulator FlrC
MNSVNLELFGLDPKVQKAIQSAQTLAASKVPVLVVGETGIGKKTLAKFIHDNSSRASKTFATVDCSAAADEVANKILGYRDEESNRFIKGVLENSNGGTVVFTNVDSLEEKFQKRIYEIFNQLADYDIDIRIICTTSKNLSKLVGSGRFYRGLYTYIAANQVFLSPLRERIGDLDNILKTLLSELSQGTVVLSDEARNKLLQHYWTHNIDEIKRVLTATLDQFEGDVLLESDLAIGEKKVMNSNSTEQNGEGITLMSLKEAEKLLIQKALLHTGENRTQAAKILGVSIRTLRNKINEYRTSGSPYFVNLR